MNVNKKIAYDQEFYTWAAFKGFLDSTPTPDIYHIFSDPEYCVVAVRGGMRGGYYTKTAAEHDDFNNNYKSSSVDIG